jgi:tRNA U34 5-methylaminomethyl-2-thiouridine-forming methyltransferase MnmC
MRFSDVCENMLEAPVERIQYLKVQPTQEGVHTVYDTRLKEYYHSIFGSLQESLHVFIRNGFLTRCLTGQNPVIHLLEVGFGTGLNALLTYREFLKIPVSVRYTALDILPLPLSFIQSLNYFDYLDSSLHDIFLKMHQARWSEIIVFRSATSTDQFTFELQKIKADWLVWSPPSRFDLIYYDAFSPVTQPELWTCQAIEKMYAVCQPGAMVVTYCARGEVKRRMRQAGFQVTALPGAHCKREMTRAIKI